MTALALSSATYATQHERRGEAAQPPLRTCACGKHLAPGGGECEQCRRVRTVTLQRPAVSSTAPPDAVPPIFGDPGRSTGRTMEGRFGRDFSSVRVHTGPSPAASAQAVEASAGFGSGPGGRSWMEGQQQR
jgi:Domain of unknown function (DUF4157)